jgi:hypothetical protein
MFDINVKLCILIDFEQYCYDTARYNNTRSTLNMKYNNNNKLDNGIHGPMLFQNWLGEY